MSKRLAFCNRIEEMIQDNEFDAGDIFSDKSHFYLKCSPNMQNNREWRLTDQKIGFLCLFTLLKLQFDAD